MWLHSLKVAQLLHSAACLHTNQSRSYLNHIVLTVKEQRNILLEISKRKAIWIGHILHRNCLLQRVIEGKIKWRIEITGRRGRRRRKLLDDLKDREDILIWRKL